MTLGLEELTDIAIALAILIGLSFAVLIITRLVVMPVLRRIIKKTRFEWDDVFLDAKTFKWLGYILPAVVFLLGTEILDSDYVPIDLQVSPSVLDLLQQFAFGFIVLCIMMAINASLGAVNTIYSQKAVARSRPIKGFVQLGKIFVAIIGSICAVALVFGQEPWEFLKYTAGMTAVLLFVFKDTILSLVASIQLTSNQMLQVGDWIDVPSCGADGDVIDVALHTVKVRNFDKTIVTVPTRKLVDGAFRNWRGMQDSGGRRIKRDLNIDLRTIRFLDDEDIARLRKIQLISGYIEEKESVVDTKPADGPDRLNDRRLTNIGTFRAYIAAYLRSLPDLHGEFTFLVRQLQPTQVGLPIQIYIFTNTTSWVAYEGIQSDIFDHLLAAVPDFGLRVFQEPSGHDVVNAATA
jgi:miniconductance mechanosensitive channel